ncbi:MULTISPECIES: foldase protein PrsA [Staphylococcus]|jgi:foldase protein PrsA|uniref:peptidylprolyl isomerase n=2 Tax=Staphylococcus hominis TaxID=1290 RepID=A0A4Q9WMK6_STAHO|nr:MULTISPECIES: foldase protein PrsA [Staphylococcus]EUZ67581.1 foldase prsA [Staphylococcus sp. M0480]OFM62723.1 peptidylprolyl isomerase [Staphylococcus sp. HMSC062C01]OFM63336.1 peptidylprolyl isomerase [Staphylococcus sp. HMSC068D07]OFM75761.1 peptidylprolyl isomerase [Staphylococcus sp. HMSC074B09]OFM91738.1 peptidylprolyl isomerase [Staphylococcus sp. HMSC078D05]OFN10703.1 peptidylprolyl isomerase [Staphylococcus sp. HMSC058D09]OFR09581.1 peptidylprolyl isomerase [Staphylococcus sp. H
MKIMNKLIVPVTAGVLLLGGCSSDSTDSKDNTLISSKAGNVTVKDVMDKIGKDQIASTSFSIELNKILADKYKDKVDTKRIDDDIKKEEKQYGGKDQFESMLKQQGMTLDDYKEQKRLSAYQKQLLNDKVKVSDKEIKDDTKKASHILIKVKSDSDKEGLSDKKAKAKAEKIQKEVEKNPNKFDDIAKKESMDSASAKKGGSLGYVIKGQMVDKFDKALFKLKEGQISDIVKTEYGYHIIKADKEDDFNKQKSQLKTKIIEQKVQKNPKLLTNAYKDLLKEYNVDYKDSDIKKSVEDTILNPEKLKEQQSSSASSGLSS